MKDNQIKDKDQEQNSFKLRLDAAEVAMSNTNSEKEHLELSLQENRKLKDQYFKKSEETQEKYQVLFKEFSEIQKDKVAIDEIKMDRDQRIKKLRRELTEVHDELDELNKQHSALEVKHEWQTTEQGKMDQEHKDMTESLNQANEVRQKTQESLKRLQQDFELQTIKLKNELENYDIAQKELTRCQTRLLDAEKSNDQLEIQRDSLQKQSEIQLKQLQDRIKEQEQLLSNEKDVREAWINKYELEQKSNVQIDSDLLQLRGEHSDAMIKLKNLDQDFKYMIQQKNAL